MPKMKKLEVNLKPIKADIEKAIKTMQGFKSKVSAADNKKVNAGIRLLHRALRDVKQTCKNGKMTAGFNVG